MNSSLIAAVAIALAAPLMVGVAFAHPAPAIEGTPNPVLSAPISPPAAEAQAAAAKNAEPTPDAMPESASLGAVPDPWEAFNRRMYRFNDAVDRSVLEPLAKGYRVVTPRFARTGVTNVLDNLITPVTAVNALLQGTPGRAGAAVGRFGVNSTIGLAGLFDIATEMGIPKHNEDFGQTLAVWGVKSGPYLMLPFAGPSTLRDFPGGIIDNAFKPLNYVDDATEVRVGLAALRVVSAREAAIETVDGLRANSPDPYVTIRTVFGQSRASAIRNGRQSVEDLPDFGGPP